MERFERLLLRREALTARLRVVEAELAEWREAMMAAQGYWDVLGRFSGTTAVEFRLNGKVWKTEKRNGDVTVRRIARR
jgi:chromosome condensin MukBEF ATPase and DNA-binding subunit MukB